MARRNLKQEHKRKKLHTQLVQRSKLRTSTDMAALKLLERKKQLARRLA